MDNIYIKSNRKEKKKIGRKVLLLIVLALIFFGLFKGCQLTMRSIKGLDLIKVKKINVKAPSNMDPQELIRASGIMEGQGILSISIDEAKKRIASNKWVKKVKIRRALPSTISIEVEPKQVKATALEQSSLYYLDEQGKVIDRFIPGYHNDVITISSKRENYARAISIISELKKLEPVSEISIEQDVLTVYSSKFSFKIRLDMNNINEGISKAFRVIEDLKDRSETARVIDASLPGNKVVVIGLRKI